MMPWWCFGAGLACLGTLAVAPYVAGASILVVLGLSMAQLEYGLAYLYWQSLDLPAFQPYATRIRWAGGIGFLIAPSTWGGWMCRCWWQGRERRSLAPKPCFDSPATIRRDRTWSCPDQPLLSRHRMRRIALPKSESLLLAAPGYPATYAVLKDALRDIQGPLLVIDLEGSLHAATAGWRAGRGEVVRLSPFGGGGRPWNPLAKAWTPQGLCPRILDELAACWYPERGSMDRALVSHVRRLFVALVGAADDVLRASGETVPPAPGDLWQLDACKDDVEATRSYLRALARLPALRAPVRTALEACAALDDNALRRITSRLRTRLAVFAPASIDAGTRGSGLSLAEPATATVYLDIPYASRDEVVPVIEAFVAQWLPSVRHHAPTVAIHAADLLPPMPFLTHTDTDLRCLASVRSMAALFAGHDGETTALARRFGVLALHAPGERALAEREAVAVGRYMAAQTAGSARNTPVSVDDLLALRAQDQIVVSRSLLSPVRCRILASARSAPTPPMESQGEAMSFPKPLAALLASLVAGCSAPAPLGTASAERPLSGVPVSRTDDHLRHARLGPQRFRLSKTLFKGLHQPKGDGSSISFILRWPSLEPWPADVYIYRDQNTFLSSLRITINHLDRLTDEQYRARLKRNIEPIVPDDPMQRADPADNLDLRIKGEPVHGLTPYYTDFAKLKRFYLALYGPDTRAGEPDSSSNDDWYLDMGSDGIPRTVITCSPAVIPDGVVIENGQLRHKPEVFRRATCDHSFLIPEYKARVNLSYQRAVMPDWQRIETSVRDILRQGEVSE
ncbi:hypothetical protein [Luteibacter sp.]|uniref:hypothetical protein n=1 Tax=Luteibacter sp. TaxID=1886636 RepID=UPI002F3ED5E2